MDENKTVQANMTTCPNCSEKISVYTKDCPHCGVNIKEFEAEKERKECERRKAAVERRSLEFEEEKKANTYERFCPACGEPVRFADENCKNCGFPLKDVDLVQAIRKARNEIRYFRNGIEKKGFWCLVAASILLFASMIICWAVAKDIMAGILICVFWLVVTICAWYNSPESKREKLQEYQQNFDAMVRTEVHLWKNHYYYSKERGCYVRYCPYCDKETKVIFPRSIIRSKKNIYKEVMVEHDYTICSLCGRIYDKNGKCIGEHKF